MQYVACYISNVNNIIIKNIKLNCLIDTCHHTVSAEFLGHSRTQMTGKLCMHGSLSHTGSYMPTVQQILSSTISSAVSL